MIAASFGRCPVCGEQHPIPDCRSFDREEMGCDYFQKHMPAQPKLVHAPWTMEQVRKLARYQRLSHLHPYTCGWSENHGEMNLIPTARGWICPACDYTQDWFLVDSISWMV